MNKRARLTRRILREHRRFNSLYGTRSAGHYVHQRWHVTSQRWHPAWHPVMDIWVCPHCTGYDSVRPKGTPLAYR